MSQLSESNSSEFSPTYNNNEVENKHEILDPQRSSSPDLPTSTLSPKITENILSIPKMESESQLPTGPSPDKLSIQTAMLIESMGIPLNKNDGCGDNGIETKKNDVSADLDSKIKEKFVKNDTEEDNQVSEDRTVFSDGNSIRQNGLKTESIEDVAPLKLVDCANPDIPAEDESISVVKTGNIIVKVTTDKDTTHRTPCVASQMKQQKHAVKPVAAKKSTLGRKCRLLAVLIIPVLIAVLLNSFISSNIDKQSLMHRPSTRYIHQNIHHILGSVHQKKSRHVFSYYGYVPEMSYINGKIWLPVYSFSPFMEGTGFTVVISDFDWNNKSMWMYKDEKENWWRPFTVSQGPGNGVIISTDKGLLYYSDSNNQTVSKAWPNPTAAKASQQSTKAQESSDSGSTVEEHPSNIYKRHISLTDIKHSQVICNPDENTIHVLDAKGGNIYFKVTGMENPRDLLVIGDHVFILWSHQVNHENKTYERFIITEFY